MVKKVYVAGPMRGHPQFNFPAFDTATEVLREQGYTVFSPAEHDREIGFDERHDTIEVDRATMTEMIMWDLKHVAEADMLYVLRGWEKSTGCAVELALAKFLGTEVVYE